MDKPTVELNDEGLTPMEVAFLDCLFDTHKGNFKAAMDAVGYHKTASSSLLRKKLAKHIQEASKLYLISSTARAASGLVSVFDDPAAVGNKNLIAAAKEVLDRSGVFKEEQVKVTEIRNMFILPAKEEVTDGES